MAIGAAKLDGAKPKFQYMSPFFNYGDNIKHTSTTVTFPNGGPIIACQEMLDTRTSTTTNILHEACELSCQLFILLYMVEERFISIFPGVIRGLRW